MARPRVESVSGSLIELAGWPPEGLSETEVDHGGERQSLVQLRQATQLRAWLNICPHAARRLDWAPGKVLVSKGLLVCAAHGASFELDQGLCVAGPCRGASLVPVRVAVAGG